MPNWLDRYAQPDTWIGELAALYGVPVREVIRLARAKADISAQQLGDRLAVSRQTISHWETGAHSPTSLNMRRLADQLAPARDRVEQVLLDHVNANA